MLATWNPFAHRSIARASSPVDLENTFQRLLLTEPSTWKAMSVDVPAADVFELENEFVVRVDLPGHDPARLQLTVENDMLIIQSERTQPEQLQRAMSFHAERACGTFSRSFALPKSVDSTRTEAKLEHGVLTVTLPKREESKPRSVSVKVSS